MEPESTLLNWLIAAGILIWIIAMLQGIDFIIDKIIEIFRSED
jgi:hypothetical protein